MQKAPYGHGCSLIREKRECGKWNPDYTCKRCEYYVRKVRDIKTGRLVPEAK